MNIRFDKRHILGIAASCIGAACALAQISVMTRTSSAPALQPDETRTARNTPVHAKQPQPERAIRSYAASDTEGPITILDKIPALDDDISKYVVADIDNDDYTWTLENNRFEGKYFELQSFESSGNFNDWLFIPVEIPVSGGDLNLSLRAATSYDSPPHGFKICLGNASTPEAMTFEITDVAGFNTNGTSWSKAKTVEAKAKGPEAGQYWLGIHAYSQQAAYRLWIKDISLTVTPSSAPSTGPNGEIFEMHPTEEEFAACTLIDGNEDGCVMSWWVHEDLNGNLLDWPIYYNSYQSSHSPAASSDADEWLITPAIDFPDAEKLYTVSIDAASTRGYGSEAFEIVMAKSTTLEAMRQGRTILDEPAITAPDFVACSSRFGIPEAGKWHVGIHIKSQLDAGWRIALKNLKICITETSSCIPGICTGLSVKPDPKGALKATVEFAMPSIYINDAEIPASEELEAEISTPAGKKTVKGTRGEPVSVTVDAVEGTNVVDVTVRNTNGAGQTSRKVVRCGIDTPVDPVVTTRVSDDNTTINLTWEPVSQGQNGGVVDPDGVKYNIYEYLTDGQTSGWYPLKKGLTDCKFEYSPGNTEQNLYQLQVSASNEKGESTGSITSYSSAVLGTPHKLPMSETFPNGGMKYSGLLLDYPDETYTAQWALDNPSNVGISGGPDYALMCLVMEMGNEGKGYVELPKFSTEGCSKVRLKILSYICNATPNTVIKIHSTEGRAEAETLGTIDTTTGQGWCELAYDLPEKYMDNGWNVISFDVNCEHAGQVFVIGEAHIYESKAHDLAVTRTDMPAYVRLGEEVEFKAFVENRGYQEVAAPALKAELLESGKLMRNVDISFTPATLSENQNAEYTGKIMLGNADMEGKDLTLRLSIDANDEVADNDAISVDFRTGIGGRPVAADLTATLGANEKDVIIEWSNPHADGYVENQEAYPHGFYEGRIGVWKNLDCDRASTYHTESFNIPDAGLPKAFQVVNTVLCGMNGMQQPSGDQFLMVFCPEGGQADDWLVSPEVKGGSEVKFFMTSLATQYEESIEVMVSTTDDELDSFKPLETFVTKAAGWNLYEVKLPEDAKHFALHYVSNDKFGLCIDDIVYSPVSPETEITGWNIYRDGNAIQSGHPSTVFTDANASESVHAYNVAAVGRHNGVEIEFPLSVTVKSPKSGAVEDVSTDERNISVADGILTVHGCDGLPVEIISLAGLKVYGIESAPAKVEKRLDSGVYIVRIDGKSLKATVR